MLRFYYNPAYKYTNRKIISIDYDTNFSDFDYANIDSPDTINGHIIYKTNLGQNLPTYIVDLDNKRRWFVSGITQLRTGKYQISLLRDIISENPDMWSNEQAYINAGKATNYNRFKIWELPFTNTKVKQQRLDINGKSSFFVFYVNEQKMNGNIIEEQNLQIKYSSIPGVTNFDYEVDDLNEIPNFEIVGAGKITSMQNFGLYFHAIMQSSSYNYAQVYKWQYDKQYNRLSSKRIGQYGEVNIGIDNRPITLQNVDYDQVDDDINGSKTALRDAIINRLNTDYYPSFNYVDANIGIENYINKYILDKSSGKVYTIKKTGYTKVFEEGDAIENNGEFSGFPTIDYSLLNSAVRRINFPIKSGNASFSFPDAWLYATGIYSEAEYILQELGTATSFDFNFIAKQRKLPKSAVRCVNIVASGTITDSDIAQSLMLAQTNPGMTSETAGTGRILDIQYLPFSVANTTNENIKINDTPLVAQFLDNDDFEYSVDLPDLEAINKETDTIKIVSPSRASQFLFRPYNNNGNMLFETKITVRPHTSIIYIRPSTQGLLLADWDDKDCLIIQEDFSLTNVTSQWAEYIYNNINFQSIFNREIQGREFQRDWERRVERAQARSDEWTARNISAQKAQTYTANLPIISDIAGAIGTAWQDNAYMQAAALDRQYNEALYQEGLSLARDNFNMQLENIQAQPNIPSKITTIDVKMLDGVYLEFYSTNETELKSIENFYKYNGERIDDYGTFNSYWGWFVRGKIIIANNYTQPEIDELNRRLNMGIFTGEDYVK